MCTQLSAALQHTRMISREIKMKENAICEVKRIYYAEWKTSKGFLLQTSDKISFFWTLKKNQRIQSLSNVTCMGWTIQYIKFEFSLFFFCVCVKSTLFRGKKTMTYTNAHAIPVRGTNVKLGETNTWSFYESFYYPWKCTRKPKPYGENSRFSFIPFWYDYQYPSVCIEIILKRWAHYPSTYDYIQPFHWHFSFLMVVACIHTYRRREREKNTATTTYGLHSNFLVCV